jgi:hypothetical protein
MKATVKTMMVGLLFLAACQSRSSQTQDFIPGTYVNSAKGEYAIANDTIVITSTSENLYLLTRKTTYQAIRDGKLLPKHRQVQQFQTIWNGGKQELNETLSGRVFRFDTDKKLLLLNRAVYRKVN